MNEKKYITTIDNNDYFSISESNNTELPKQTFTSLLHNPLTERNYLYKLKKKIKKPKLFYKIEKKIEFSNFTIIDLFQNDNEEDNKKHKKKVSINDNKSTTSSEEKNQKVTFELKDYINKNYDNYIKILQKHYSNFHYNHYKTTLIELKEEEISKNYISNANYVFDQIEPRFLVDERIFKLDLNLFNFACPKLQNYISYLIDQTSFIDIEFQNIYTQNELIINYITNLYPNLFRNIEFILNKIKNWKFVQKKIRQKYLYTSSQLILKKKKQNQLKKMKNFLDKIYEIKNKMINKNTIKLDVTKEFNYFFTKLKISKDINYKIESMIENKNDFIINEIENMMIKYLDNLFFFTEDEKDINGNYYGVDNNLFKEIIEFRRNNEKNIYLKINNNLDTTEIKQKYSDLNLPQNSKNKLLNRLIEINNTIFQKNILKIKSLKNNKELLYIFYLKQICVSQLKFINDILKTIEKDDFINLMKVKILDNLTHILLENIRFVFLDIESYVSNVIDLIIKNHIIKEIFKDYPIKKTHDISQIIEEYESNFIKYYLTLKENKLREGIKFDNFLPLEIIPNTFQIYINKICEFNLLKVDSFENVIEFFKMDIQTNNENISYIKFPNNIIIQIMPTSLDLITYTFETIKMLSSFSINNYFNIIYSFSSILKLYSQLNKEIIIELKGHISNISENELSITYSNFTLIKELISSIYKNDKMKLLNQFTNGNFEKVYEEVITLIEMNENSLKKKVNELIEKSIHNCFIQFENTFNKKKYTVVNNPEIQINNFALAINKNIKEIYKVISMVYPNDFVIQVFQNNLEEFANEIEKKLKKIKIKSQDEKRQIIKDLLFIKKNIDSGIDIDLKLNRFKDKISLIVKKYSVNNTKINNINNEDE